jgi:hypothetical protein
MYDQGVNRKQNHSLMTANKSSENGTIKIVFTTKLRAD